ncbi:MAG: carbamoyl-phosphate synthase large subunit [Planctomycetota bacterium]|jgi:carbamoyl-phosphate synthase large subunit|nr:carbamoyl-phosphate synthase large subunit [Planctomycetota bacterium]
MPKRDDIKRILLVGSGPIVIGQACEFDYSGAQACKALREEGYELVLMNSNPATIMTDPELADRTYIEPMTADFAAEVIRRERPDAILPTMGGQTGLNIAMDLHKGGILFDYGVEMIGATPEAIEKSEDRGLFREAMRRIGLNVPESGSARTLEEAMAVRNRLLTWPVVIRPGFTLGGAGGGIARDQEEFERLAARGLAASPASEILVEESLLGWKEFEYEVMRDRNSNNVIVCTIENLDPMGVHTGDSITVAPAMTLTDREYQLLRDASLAVMNEIGVDTGGANVQFAVNPENGRMVVIEMNPRVSRSSALASKATGFPIARIAAKLAVGYALDELLNDITRATTACFEPALDYVVVKAPRFNFEKFAGTSTTLGTQMKSVGETMAIGRTFKEALQKALRGLETGRAGFGLDGKDGDFLSMPREKLAAEAARPSDVRVFALAAALRLGFDVEELHRITSIDRWFLREMAEIVAFSGHVRENAVTLEDLAGDVPLFRQAKAMGFSDRQLAQLYARDENEVRNARHAVGLRPSFQLVDTCAAEFASLTPYYYSTYASGVSASLPDPGGDLGRIMILGGGPNRIGQGIEFDYCCCHASFALRDAGWRTIMVNSNPETVSTDFDTADVLYFEPLTLEDVLEIHHRERPGGSIVQFGGQTPLNLADSLAANGVRIIGTPPASIDMAEDRKLFGDLMDRLGIRQPAHGMAADIDEALEAAKIAGYPVLARPSFVLGGRNMVIAHEAAALRRYMLELRDVSRDRPVLIDHYLEQATEVDVDCLCDGTEVVIGGMMEHIEIAGIHSGDSACALPPPNLAGEVMDRIRRHTRDMALALKVRGLMNVQFAVQREDIFVLEVNPRASRTVPFVSKATGVPLAKLAALCMAGWKLGDLGFAAEPRPRHYSVKEAVFPFNRFPGAAIKLSPEMKSTGEVMGIDRFNGAAFLKSQIASGNRIPEGGNIFLSLKNSDKAMAVPLARRLLQLGFTIYATRGTSTAMRDAGLPSHALFKISRGRPNALDLMAEHSVEWVINTIEIGSEPAVDESRMRSQTYVNSIPITTTVNALEAALAGLEFLRRHRRLEVCSLQEYNRRGTGVKLPKNGSRPTNARRRDGDG